MIAHVAAAEEQRGRVVVALGPTADAGAAVISAAVRVALAFQSEIESVYVEDAGLAAGVAFPFARLVSPSGRRVDSLDLATLERGWRADARVLHRRVAASAAHARIPIRSRTVRDEPMRALARVCAENGPWNVLALTEPVGRGPRSSVGAVLSAVEATTGVLVADSSARVSAGPVVAVIEHLQHVPPMQRAAQRIAAAGATEATLAIVGMQPGEGAEVEGQARLLLADQSAPAPAIAVLSETSPAMIAERLSLARPSLALARLGGALLPEESDVPRLASLLRAPVFVVR
jgi:hypothetical protein